MKEKEKQETLPSITAKKRRNMPKKLHKQQSKRERETNTEEGDEMLMRPQKKRYE